MILIDAHKSFENIAAIPNKTRKVETESNYIQYTKDYLPRLIAIILNSKKKPSSIKIRNL